MANSFDLVISNPPFSITLDPNTQAQLESTFELAQERNSENLFLERWYQLLKPKGRLGVVLPESFFSTKENLNARLFLFAHFNIKAIVALPRHTFEPWTPTRTSLLFAEKKTLAEEQKWKDEAVAAEQTAREQINRAKKANTTIKKAISLVTVAEVHTAVGTIISGLKTLGTTVAGPKLDSTLSLQVIANSLSQLLKKVAEQKLTKPPDAEFRKSQTKLEKATSMLQEAVQAIATIGSINAEFELGVVMPKGELDSIEDLYSLVTSTTAATSQFDPRLWGFVKGAQKYNSSFYVVNIENIGFKRTKRAESERRNDLFAAFATGEHSTKVRVLNLNHFPNSWWIEHTSSDDAASLLRKAFLWK